MDLPQYGANLAEIYRRLASKGKKLIWTTTTPCPNVRLAQLDHWLQLDSLSRWPLSPAARFC